MVAGPKRHIFSANGAHKYGKVNVVSKVLRAESPNEPCWLKFVAAEIIGCNRIGTIQTRHPNLSCFLVCRFICATVQACSYLFPVVRNVCMSVKAQYPSVALRCPSCQFVGNVRLIMHSFFILNLL